MTTWKYIVKIPLNRASGRVAQEYVEIARVEVPGRYGPFPPDLLEAVQERLQTVTGVYPESLHAWLCLPVDEDRPWAWLVVEDGRLLWAGKWGERGDPITGAKIAPYDLEASSNWNRVMEDIPGR